MNTGYLPAPATSKSPVFDNLAKLSKVQSQNIQQTVKVAGVPTQKKQTSQQQLKQPLQQQKLKTQQPKQQPEQQKPHIKQTQQQQQNLKQQKPQVKQQQQQQQTQVKQQQLLKQQQIKQAQRLKFKQQQQQHKQVNPNVQQEKKPLVQKKPVLQHSKVVNKTPQGQRQVQQNKPFLISQGNRIDLKQLDPKIAEASRKAKIALAVTKNAQILRKLHSVDLNGGQRPTEQVSIKPKVALKSVTQQKQQRIAFNIKLNPSLSPDQIKNIQKQQVKKLQLNPKQQILKQKKLNVQNINKQNPQGSIKQVKPNLAPAKH